jgi:CheY-like chemotaxis protein
MPNNSPIIVIEDDDDDQKLLSDVILELNLQNELKIFGETKSAFEYLLNNGQPFLIICDINLPLQNGIEFKRQIDQDPVLWKKSIPFVFLTTNPQPATILSAYHELTVQGFFQKPHSFAAYKELVYHLVSYWRICRHPND